MLPGFEDITEDLTRYELDVLVPIFLKGFRTKRGAENAVTNKQIVARLKPHGYKINDVRVRKVINYIRTNNLVPGLIASSKGYYVTEDPIEIGEYIRSLDARINEINRVRNSMADHLFNVKQWESQLESR